jgi:hypothetical protein
MSSVAAQEDRRRFPFAQLSKRSINAHPRPAIDVVPEEDQRVGARLDLIEEDVELLRAAAQVADRKDTHHSPPSTSRRSVGIACTERGAV